MPEPTFHAMPILRIFDIEKAKEFYVGYLGFTVDWEHRFEETLPLYMCVSRGGMEIHLSEHHGDGTPGSAVYIETTGIVAYHAELSAKKYGYLRPGIGPTPWGSICMDLIDPFGNALRFNETVQPESTPAGG